MHSNRKLRPVPRSSLPTRAAGEMIGPCGARDDRCRGQCHQPGGHDSHHARKASGAWCGRWLRGDCGVCVLLGQCESGTRGMIHLRAGDAPATAVHQTICLTRQGESSVPSRVASCPAHPFVESHFRNCHPFGSLAVVTVRCANLVVANPAIVHRDQTGPKWPDAPPLIAARSRFASALGG